MDANWERTRPYYEINTVEIGALFKKASMNIDVTKHEIIHSGLRNTNICVEGKDKKYLLRIYASEDNWWEKEKAIADNIPRDVTRPALLFVSGPTDVCTSPFAVFEYIDGYTLDQGAKNRKIYAGIGEKLAILHNYRHYNTVGFFDKNLEIQTVLPPLVNWYTNFITDTVIKKLGKKYVELLIRLISCYPSRFVTRVVTRTDPPLVSRTDPGVVI